MKTLLVITLGLVAGTVAGCIDPPPASPPVSPPNNTEPVNVTPNNVTSNNTPVDTSVGAPCTRSSDCETGVCVVEELVGIPDGYCSKLCDDMNPCDEGTHCGALREDRGGICLRTCENDFECTRTDFRCLNVDLDRTQECWPLGVGEGKVGDPCQSVADCAGAGNAFCQTEKQGFKDGYCTRFCGDDGDCDMGSHCTGAGVCASNICEREGYLPYDFDGDGSDECWAAATGSQPIGGPCEGSWDCDGGIEGFCLTEVPGGYCTKVCATTSCPDQSQCYPVEDSAVCLASCDPLESSPCRDPLECRDLALPRNVCWLSEDP